MVKNKKSGKILKFELKRGLFLATFDAGRIYSSLCKIINTNITPYLLATIETVEKNEKAHATRDVTRAKAVLSLIQALGYPSHRDLKKMIQSKSIANCPVTVADVDRFYRIYGGAEGVIKGKTVRKTPKEVNVDENVAEIPEELSRELEKVTMSMDILFVEKIPFLTTVSGKLLFTTARALKNREHSVVFEAIMEVLHIVDLILSDNEFRQLKERLRKEAEDNLNLAAPYEHVPEIERNIRLIKERLRSMLAGMPYKKLPKHFKRELVLTCASMLNVVPREAHYRPWNC